MRALHWWAVVTVGCAPAAGPMLVTEIVDAPGATGEGFGDPRLATNGVRGGGAEMGSTDTYSLDYAERTSLTLGTSGRAIADGPGADLVVFENAFQIHDSPSRFMDLLVVSVSADGETWAVFPHDYVAADETAYSRNPDDWVGFAGRTPVLLDVETNPIDPFSELAGGDAFDLAELPDGPAEDAIRRDGFRYVRLTVAATLVNPDTGAPYPRDAASNGPDIDGIYVR